MGRILITITVAIGLLVGAMALIFEQELRRLNYQRSLFSGAPQHENFDRQHEYYPIHAMAASTQPYLFPSGARITLPASFTHRDQTYNTLDFIGQTDTTALLVIQDGQLRYEDYWLTGAPNKPWLTHSVSKTFVATGVGLAIHEGLINSVEDPIDQYVPQLASSGYQGVSIRNVLQMSSGIRWNEDYADSASDLNQFGLVMLTGSSYDSFVAARVSERPPGVFNSYTGMDAQALTMLVRAVTGGSLADYLRNKLWEPIGMQDRAYWTTDNQGTELGLGGLSATARDLAKLGELYRLNGNWLGQQLLDPSWVEDATTVTAAHLERGENPNSKHRMGYGYQWWLPDGDNQDFSAIGIYNQFVYVNPEHQTVIVKLSAYRNYAMDSKPASYLESETFSLFRQIAQSLSKA